MGLHKSFLTSSNNSLFWEFLIQLYLLGGKFVCCVDLTCYSSPPKLGTHSPKGKSPFPFKIIGKWKHFTMKWINQPSHQTDTLQLLCNVFITSSSLQSVNMKHFMKVSSMHGFFFNVHFISNIRPSTMKRFIIICKAWYIFLKSVFNYHLFCNKTVTVCVSLTVNMHVYTKRG